MEINHFGHFVDGCDCPIVFIAVVWRQGGPRPSGQVCGVGQ